MTSFLEKLPTILVLAVLVGIFVSLQKHARSWRLRFWTVAWGLILAHFFVQMFLPRDGVLGAWLSAGQIGFLQLSAIVFVFSLAAKIENARHTVPRLLVFGTAALVYSGAIGYGVESRCLYVVCLTLLFGYGTVAPLWKMPRWSIYRVALALTLAAAGIWSVHAALHGSYGEGLLALLTIGFALPGVLFWRRYQRPSPGVLTVTGGFLCWGAVFPLGSFFYTLYPRLAINPELWNVPKFFVAFGIILTLIEDKSLAVESARERAQEINAQLQRFARITSRLLTGAEFNRPCEEIALAIRETSTFGKIAILLANDDQRLYLAGHSGIATEAEHELRQRSHGWTTDHISSLCSAGTKIGQSSSFIPADLTSKHELILHDGSSASGIRAPHALLMPLFFSHGKLAGCILLDEPAEFGRINSDEISRIELLAGDLAISIENTALHRQLVRSEKLAALGQLVAGVAHELNNPLTSVIGYGELISDEIGQESDRQKLDALLREADRMKRIVQNLLRFARQGTPARRVANVTPALTEVLMLREYYLRNQNIRLRTEIAPDLPDIEITEDEFKQVLLNLLNNAIDAVEDQPEKCIDLECTAENNSVKISVSDSGPGFANLDRAFDPFYTTKPVGKGTGLGLSICYGIVKERGGEISIRNLQPRGACVTVELPVATREIAMAAL